MSESTKPSGHTKNRSFDLFSASLARIEGLLRVSLREQLSAAVPGPWAKGRKAEILSFCSVPCTRLQIRAHIRTIGGNELAWFLSEACSLGLLVAYELRGEEHFETLTAHAKQRTRRGTRRVRKARAN